MSELHTLTKQALSELKPLLLDFWEGARREDESGYLDGARQKTIETHITSTITRLLEAEIERLEGMRKDYRAQGNISNAIAASYNTALDDHITYLKAELSKIKEV